MKKLLSQLEAIFSIFLCDRLLVGMGCIIADPTDNSSPLFYFFSDVTLLSKLLDLVDQILLRASLGETSKLDTASRHDGAGPIAFGRRAHLRLIQI